ncbi:MAG: hypothetical protein LH679_06445, partial [Cyanobacteria bacterium CAN_BIN43]|nr:hypothetical protein [Cyanobacteria bacterium CAN_BIN43]
MTELFIQQYRFLLGVFAQKITNLIEDWHIQTKFTCSNNSLNLFAITSTHDRRCYCRVAQSPSDRH